MKPEFIFHTEGFSASGAGVYAARGQVEGPSGETAVTEIAHDPDAAIRRAFARLGRQLDPAATGAAPRSN